MAPKPQSAAPEPAEALLQELASASAAIAGMQPSMLDHRSLRFTLKRRMEANSLADPSAYAEHHASSPEEQAAFLEGVLIGETSFFRDATVFAEMSRWCQQWFANHTRAMRILSAPCSSGEEPYSIAAMLQADGISLDRFAIDAVDISQLALEQAKAAVYKGFSLRNVPDPGSAPFLQRVADGWKITSELRSCVTFRKANLLDSDALEAHTYDLICSRNLLIYQSPTARRQVAMVLATALAPKGRVVLGAADWGCDLDEFFRLEEPVNSFALRLRQPDDHVPRRSTDSPTKSRKSASSLEHPPRIKSTHRPSAVSDNVSQQLADVSDLYRRALEIYLRGDERHAEKLCRQVLYLESDHIPSMELLTRMKRPHASNRMQLALHARLKRHRNAAGRGSIGERTQA